jgi:hypothetical protein
VELASKSNREPIGSALVLEIGGRRLGRVIKGGGSYLSASDRRIIFGLGASQTVDRLTVRWPSGETQVWEGKELGINHYVKLMEGEN